jgi:hypothetical protein
MALGRKILITALTAAGYATIAGSDASAQHPAPGQPIAQPEAPRTGELFLFICRPGPAWREGVPMEEQDLRLHGPYIRDLVTKGHAPAGGSFASNDGGLAIVKASHINEAGAMLEADPAIQSGIFIATLEHWRPRFHTDFPMPRPWRLLEHGGPRNGA